MQYSIAALFSRSLGKAELDARKRRVAQLKIRRMLMSYTDDRMKRIEVFTDTMNYCRENKRLSAAIEESRKKTVIYKADGTMPPGGEALPPENVTQAENGAGSHRQGATCQISVTPHRTFEAVMKLKKDHPQSRIGVLNFASATNPGGGVKNGSSAQEECLCRCSTLYPVLTQDRLFKGYYAFHRNRHDTIYTDTCIYTPDIYIIKTDANVPKRLPENDWCPVDVITCAAPNLREKPYNAMNPGSGQPARVTADELLKLHKSRGRRILSCAAFNGVDILVLGAFGCGAFRNPPEIVAQAYRDILGEFAHTFEMVEFAVYCSPRDRTNFDVFRQMLGGD